jgi:hypothetical protein
MRPNAAARKIIGHASRLCVLSVVSATNAGGDDMIEQQWTYRGLSGCVVDAAGRQLTADDVSDEVLRFIAAAPAMARALLEVREALSTNTLCSEGAQEMCERVLKQAGVLP